MECLPVFAGLFAAALCFLVGFMGTVVPVIPAAPVVLIGIFLYGLIADFSHLSLTFFVGQTLLTASTFVIDTVATAWGVRRSGGSRAAAWGAMGGSLLIFVMGPPGILIGPLVGAAAGELLIGKRMKEAMHSGIGSLWGFLGGTLAKIAVVGIMAAWFLASIGPQLAPCLPWR